MPCVTEVAALSLGLFLMSRGQGVNRLTVGGAALVLYAAVLYATHWRL
jgi:hypothetical protein